MICGARAATQEGLTRLPRSVRLEGDRNTDGECIPAWARATQIIALSGPRVCGQVSAVADGRSDRSTTRTTSENCSRKALRQCLEFAANTYSSTKKETTWFAG